MPKEEWGVKRLCPNCQTRFYDLGNDPMTCPNCGAVHTVESLATGKTRTMQADKADPKTAIESDDEDAVVEEESEDTADVELDDDDVLDDDDDDDNVSLDEIADVSSESEDDS